MITGAFCAISMGSYKSLSFVALQVVTSIPYAVETYLVIRFSCKQFSAVFLYKMAHTIKKVFSQDLRFERAGLKHVIVFMV